MSSHLLKYSLVFPVYNNAATIQEMVNRLLAAARMLDGAYEIIAIDDASTDESYQVFTQYFQSFPYVHVYRHKKNLGSAATYRELYFRAKGEFVILFSIDGEWEPNDILVMVDALHSADIVIGWRKEKAYRWGRKLISYLYNTLIDVLFGVSVYDAGSNKIIKKEIIRSTPIISHSVFNEAELLIRAHYQGYTIHAVPINHYHTNKLERLFPRFDLVCMSIIDCVRVFLAVRLRKE